MPHDKCRYECILSLDAAKQLGYKMCLHIGDNILYRHRGIVNHLKVLGDSKLMDGIDYFNYRKLDLKNKQILLQKPKEEEKYNDDIKDEDYYKNIEREKEEIESDSLDAELPLYQES